MEGIEEEVAGGANGAPPAIVPGQGATAGNGADAAAAAAAATQAAVEAVARASEAAAMAAARNKGPAGGDTQRGPRIIPTGMGRLGPLPNVGGHLPNPPPIRHPVNGAGTTNISPGGAGGSGLNIDQRELPDPRLKENESNNLCYNL
jgi:hypothetical protein